MALKIISFYKYTEIVIHYFIVDEDDQKLFFLKSFIRIAYLKKRKKGFIMGIMKSEIDLEYVQY